MLVDVIVAAHNRVEWLRQCLLSVLAQTHRDLRLLVVDDGSAPPLAQQPPLADILRDERVRLLAKANGGPASARNFGLDNVGRGYLLIVDSDDVLEPAAIETLLAALLRSRAEFAAGAWANFSVTPRERPPARPRPRYADSYANCVEQGWVPGAAMIRNDNSTRYNPDDVSWESLGFFLDFLAPGRPAVYVDAVIVHMRQHESPDRITIKYDHFEPLKTGRFFAGKKRRLRASSLINIERAAALDWRILGSVHSLLRGGRGGEARGLFREVNWDLIGRYPWYRRASFAWTSRHFGFPGAQSFIAVNRVLGRA